MFQNLRNQIGFLPTCMISNLINQNRQTWLWLVRCLIRLSLQKMNVSRSMACSQKNKESDNVGKTDKHILNESKEEMPKLSRTNSMNPNFRIKNHVQNKLETIVETNLPYFAHINRACICGICICGKCKCRAPNRLKIDLKHGPNCSDYKTNYMGRHGCPAHSLKQNEPFFQHNNQDMMTIYKYDYDKPNSKNFGVCSGQIFEPRHHPDKELNSIKAPFSKTSAYQENYLNFENTGPKLSFRPSQISTIDGRLPFYCQVSNKEYGNFDPSLISPLEDGKKYSQSQYKNPIAADVFLKEVSSMKECFQPYPNHERVKQWKPKVELENDKLPSFKNQFKTSSSQYDGLQNRICPARIILNKLRG